MREREPVALLERPRDFDRIAERNDDDRLYGKFVERLQPQRQYPRHARVLDDEHPAVGELLDDVIADPAVGFPRRVGFLPAVGERIRIVPGAVECREQPIMQAVGRVRFPKPAIVVAGNAGDQIAGNVRAQQVDHARRRRGTRPVHAGDNDARRSLRLHLMTEAPRETPGGVAACGCLRAPHRRRC